MRAARLFVSLGLLAACSGTPTTRGDGGTAPLKISPEAHDFGSVAVGSSSAPFAFTVSNTGRTETSALVVELSGAARADFLRETDGCSNQRLGPGKTCRLSIGFEPSASGARSATLTVEDGSEKATAALNGTGEGAGALVITPPAWSFPAQEVGSSSDSVNFTVKNAGASAAEGPVASIGGQDASEFRVVGGDCAGALDPGETCGVDVRFSPASPGAKTAVLDVASGGALAEATLTGTASAPARLVVTPASFDYGSVAVGGSASETFQVANAGEEASGAVDLSVDGSDAIDFALGASGCGAPLAAGTSCQVEVVFAPGTSGPKSAELKLSAAPGGTASVLLTGAALAAGALAIDPPSADFGQVASGTTSPPITLTVTNNGAENANNLAVSIGGSDASEFTKTDDCAGQPLAAGQSCAVSVELAPSAAAGPREATLTVTSDAGSQSAALTGSVPAPGSVTISPTAHDFGPVALGGTASFDFTVENVGGTSIAALDATLSGSDADAFAVDPSGCPSGLAPLATCTVALRFAPAKVGPASASLAVGAGAGTSSVASVVGAGVMPVAFTIAPTSHDYGSVAAGQATAPFSFALTNGGVSTSAPIQCSIGGVDADDFQLGPASSSCCGTVLGPGASCEASVLFSPAAAGSKAATLDLSSGESGGLASATLAGNALVPANVTIDPTGQDFGTVAVGDQSAAATFELTNTGEATSASLDPTLTGTGADQFSLVSNGCTSPLAGGASCELKVVFAPASGGEKGATLSVNGATASLTGTAVPPGSLTVTASLHDFGSIAVGASSATETFTVDNVGGQPTGAIDVSLGGQNPTDFAITSDGCSHQPLDAGATCDIAVTFNPASAGTKVANLSASALPGGAARAALSGTGFAPAHLSLTPSAFDFGGVAIGATSQPATFTVTNDGGAATGALSAQIPGTSEFEVSGGTCAAPLAAGASCTVEVIFSPTSRGATSPMLTVGDGTIGQSASLTGAGLAPASLTIAPPSHDFGSVVEGSSAAAVAFAVTNTGDLPSGNLAAALAGANAGDFSIASTTCASPLAGGSSCTVDVTFAPTSQGVKAATLAVGDGTIGASASLSGTGLPSGTLSISPASHDFGGLVIGQNSISYFQVKNTGSGSTGALSASITGSDAGDFSVHEMNCPNPLAANQSCSIGVEFAPASRGAKNASLTVDASPGGGASASLTGTGGAPALLRLTPAAHDFGTIADDTQSSAFAFKVSNTGDEDSGSISPTLSGDSSSFTISSSTCATLPAGGSCKVDVSFTPIDTGAMSATLTVSAAPGGSATASLTGTSVTPPNLTISPSSNSFGAIGVGSSTAAATFTVTNQGQATTSALSTALAGADAADFTKSSATDGCTGKTLAAYASCTIQVAFAPNSAGTKSATLTVSATGASTSATLTGNAQTAASLTISPASDDFGSVSVGQTSSSFDFTVTNQGQATSGAISLALSGTDAGQFRATGCAGSTIMGGGSCTVSVSFAPTSGGEKSATFTVSSSPGGSAAATLAGTGPRPAKLSITPASHDFGSVAEGAASAAQTFTVTNTGDLTSGSVTAYLAGTNWTDFTITGNGCGSSLASGASCAIEVELTPSHAGALSATLTVGNPIATASLSGTGLTPANLTVNPSSNDFGTVIVGSSSTATFTLTNTGGQDSGTLSHSTSGGNAADFAVTGGDCGTTLAGGASCTVQVTFTPSANGAESTTLSYTATPGGKATTWISGTGQTAASLSVSPTSKDFGSVLDGQTSQASFTFTNDGGQDTGTLTAALSGADASDFKIVTDFDHCTGQTIPGGFTCDVEVDFVPTSGGAKSATLTVSGSPGASASATLTGTALKPATLSVTPNAHDFGQAVTGTTSSAVTFTVTNTGDQGTGVLSAALGGTSPNQFAIVAGSDTCTNASLLAGAACTVEVEFAPTGTGSISATLTVSGSPGGSAVATLSGTGDSPGFLTLDPAYHDFGWVGAGTASAPVAFTVTNSGDATSGTISSAAITGTHAADFTVLGDGCAGKTLAGHASCSVDVEFAPASKLGDETASLAVGASPGGSATASLEGSSVAPAQLTVTPASNDFGSVGEGTSSSDVAFAFQNTGEVDTGKLPAASLSGTDVDQFAIDTDGCQGLTLQPNWSCNVTVRFAPTSTGAKSATLTESASPGGSASASLAGSGYVPPHLTISPTTHDFGTVQAGTASAEQSFTITNTGAGASWTLSSTLSGTAAGEFTIVAGSDTCSGTTLASGASCTVGVELKPTSEGSKSATLTVADAGAGTTSATLSGAAKQLAITPTSNGFGSIRVGATSTTVAFAVTNTGSTPTAGALTVALSGTGASEFTTTSDTCSGAGLGAGQRCSVAIDFAPSAVGSQSATLTVEDAPDDAATASLAGTGTALSITPATDAFGKVAVGSAQSTTFTVQNVGSGSSGPLTTTLTSSSGAFTATTDGCNSQTLAGGATCTVTVKFAPANAGTADSATLAVSSTQAGTASASLSGTGVDLTLSYPTLTFQAFVGKPQSETETLTNPSDYAVTLDTTLLGIYVDQTGNAFDTDRGACGSSLAAGASCGVTVTFDPSEVGTYTGTLVVKGYSPTAALTGQALMLTILPSPLDFGRHAAPWTDTVTIENNGGVPTGTFYPAEIVDYDASSFSTSQDTCAGTRLAAGASCTVAVTFAPTAEGALTSKLSLTVQGDGPGGIGNDDTLTGTGMALDLSPASATFPGTTPVGNDGGTATFTLSNVTGQATSQLTIAEGGADPYDFVFQPGTTCQSGHTLAANSSCAMVVEFLPRQSGTRTATITISGNSYESASATLSGTGQ